MKEANKGLRAWRLINIIRMQQLKVSKSIRKSYDNKTIIQLVNRHDTLQRRMDICYRFLY